MTVFDLTVINCSSLDGPGNEIAGIQTKAEKKQKQKANHQKPTKQPAEARMAIAIVVLGGGDDCNNIRSAVRLEAMATSLVSNGMVNEVVLPFTGLRESRAFKMSLYLDPRFTYLSSKIFNAEEKDQIQGYILDTWSRICQLNQPEPIEKSIEQVMNTSHEFDDFLTEMSGGSAPNNDTENRSFIQQLKALDSEPRQSHDYNVWQHWLERKNTHPELYGVAMVVLSTHSTQVSVERSFSALALVLSDRRVSLGEGTLDNTLLIKLNKELLERAMVVLYGCKDYPSVTVAPII
ncbi:uncharacterized protein LOC135705586 [Ochlerotatus camptorhynchus]|uniref:uncharacterized protein LOC135705586 n=1 Tax=Ochlerotatus camptorhynchus TaxID=644619 RepID=UPI0031D2CA17